MALEFSRKLTYFCEFTFSVMSHIYIELCENLAVMYLKALKAFSVFLTACLAKRRGPSIDYSGFLCQKIALLLVFIHSNRWHPNWFTVSPKVMLKIVLDFLFAVID